MKKRIHFLGIAGSGASAVAAIAQDLGFIVSGCDKDISSEFSKNLKGLELLQGHDSAHLEGVDVLAVTPAVFSLDPNNMEVKSAREKGIEVLTWQEFMGKYLMEDKAVIAVCGTHGKSTTTAMVAKLLEDASFDPTVELGAIVPGWGSNYRLGKGKYFVSEADEFNDNFLSIKGDIAIVTTIEMDHPEYFKNFEEYKTSFVKFLGQTKQLIIANMSDPGVAEVIKRVMKHSKVTCVDYSKSEFDIKLKVMGKHNEMNASAVFSLGLFLGVSTEKIRASLEEFEGIGRRLEKIGEINGAKVYSDFGHHPTEIEKTIQALRGEWPDKSITLVFQPHMFSRTKYLLDDFVRVFRDLPVERAWILDIYPSREVDTGLVSAKELVDAIGRKNVAYVEDIVRIESDIKNDLSKEKVLIFMGAGSIDKIARNITHKNGL